MGPLRNENSYRPLFRGIFVAILILTLMCLAGCGSVVGSLTSVTPPSPTPNLTATDVSTLIQAAAQAADPNTMVIAVVDRTGRVLGVYRKPAAPALAAGQIYVSASPQSTE